MTSMMPNETYTSTTGGTGGASSAGGSGGAQEKLSRVAGEAPAQASKVAHDVKTQLRTTTQRTLSDARSQADERASKAAQGLRDLSTRAQALAEGRTEEAGNLGDMVETFGRQASEFAERLEMGGVQGLLDDVSRFGRRRPMAFLALAVGAGFVAGRLVRTGAEVTSSDVGNSGQMRPMTSVYGGMPLVEDQFTGVLA